MLFDCSKLEDIKEGVKYFKKLARSKKVIEIVNKPIKRSLKQNKYWHLLIGFCATQMNTPRQYMSEVMFKGYYNKDIFEESFTNARNKSFTYLKSSKDITDQEMNLAITRVINGFREDMGILLPLPEELTYEHRIYMENEIEKAVNRKEI